MTRALEGICHGVNFSVVTHQLTQWLTVPRAQHKDSLRLQLTLRLRDSAITLHRTGCSGKRAPRSGEALSLLPLSVFFLLVRSLKAKGDVRRIVRREESLLLFSFDFLGGCYKNHSAEFIHKS